MDRGARPRVVLGMSGGVDSTAAAWLLLEEGYDVTGVTLRLYDGGCGGEDAVQGAAQACDQLGIPHRVAADEERFSREVLDYFAASYRAGLTPNPCVRCNRTVKFPSLLEAADREGARYLATGHYARVREMGGRFLLQRGADRSKDQSYFLYALPQSVLARTLFPLGGLTKAEVRRIAAARGLEAAHRRDSQDICFLPDGDYPAFLARHTGEDCPPGDFLDGDGNVIGRHEGHVRYTLGQRRGLRIALGQRTYVVGKDPARNTVTLGSEDALYARRVAARDLNWIACDRLDSPCRLTAKTRYSQTEASVTVWQTGEDALTAVFDTPQRAVTPGQALVLYDGETVVGGGTICQTEEI